MNLGGSDSGRCTRAPRGDALPMVPNVYDRRRGVERAARARTGPPRYEMSSL